jgi:hypothetical protein
LPPVGDPALAPARLHASRLHPRWRLPAVV